MEAYSSVNYNSGAGPTSQQFGLTPNIATPGPNWHWTYHPNGSGALSMTAGTIFFSPLFPGRPCTLTTLAYQISTQGTGTGTQLFRAGIYESSSSTGRPTGSPLIDFGTQDLEATTGIKVWNVTNVDLDPKLYWFASVKQTSGGQSTAGAPLGIFQNSTNAFFAATDTASTPTTLATGALSFQQTGATSGTLPSIGTLTAYQGSVPCVLFKFA